MSYLRETTKNLQMIQGQSGTVSGSGGTVDGRMIAQALADYLQSNTGSLAQQIALRINNLIQKYPNKAA